MVAVTVRWFVLAIMKLVAGEYEDNTANSKLKNSLIHIPADYVRSQPPIPENKALKISIDIGLWAIRDISAGSMDMEVDLLLYVMWQDYRVKINTSMAEAIGGRIPVGDDGPKLWLPVIQFRNCRGCKLLDFNPNTYIIHYHSEMKSLWTAIRTVEFLSCNIDLSNFPMDRQNCKIQLENYYEDTLQIYFAHQHSGPYKILSEMELSEFKILDIVAGDCSATYGNKSYACIEVEVRLARVMGYHLTTTFAPTMLIVMLSWISFWLPIDMAPARVTLGVTSLLTLATRLDQAQKNLPAVSYVKAIDIWMFACIFLVFSSLIEFALSYYLKTIENNAITNHGITSPSQCRSRWANKILPHDKKLRKNTRVPKLITTVDQVSKVLFPGFFLAFNICYWSKYLSKYYED